MRRLAFGVSLLLAASILAARFSGAASEAPKPTVSVAHFRGDKAAAVSFTFDDGIQSHADIASPLLHQFGYRGTFYIIAGLTRQHKADPRPALPFKYGEAGVSWDEVRAMAKAGHEIGNHSMSHTFLTRLPNDTALEHEIADAARLIEQNVGVAPATFACPYNEYNDHVKAAILRHHLAVREGWTDYGGQTFTADTANSLVKHAIDQHAWLVPMIHGIDGGFLPLKSGVLRANLAYVQQHDDQLWVDTYAAVAKYQQERAAVKVDVQTESASAVTLTVDDGLDDKRFDEPLTLVVQTNDRTPTEPAAAQEGHELPLKVVGSRILVDAIPTNRPIQVSWK